MMQTEKNKFAMKQTLTFLKTLCNYPMVEE